MRTLHVLGLSSDDIVFILCVCVPFSHISYDRRWDELKGTELYDHGLDDSVENAAESVNVVALPGTAAVVKELSAMLHAGWRGLL